MNFHMSFKIALFTFLSAIVCTIGYDFTFIEVLSIISSVLWFVSYICAATWVLHLIRKKVKLTKSIVVAIYSLLIAIYSGVYIAMGVDMESIAGFISTCLFYLSVLVCIITTIICIWRFIFSSSKPGNVYNNNQGAMPMNLWTCSCGRTNSGKFCTDCGKSNMNA